MTYSLQAPCGAYMGPSPHQSPHWCKEEADHDGAHLCGICRVQWDSSTTTPTIHEDTPDPYQGAGS